MIYYVCLCLYKQRKRERLHMLSILVGERAPVGYTLSQQDFGLVFKNVF